MAALVRVTHHINATRSTNSASSDGTYYTINFFKESTTSQIIVEAVIPARENYNDGAYLYTELNGTRKYTGVIETPMDSVQSQQTLVKQTWNGVPAGSRSIRFGWSSITGDANNPWVINNPNGSDEARNQQTGTEWVIWEIEP